MAALSKEQLAFLADKSVPLSRVFDATGMSKSEYHDAMKPLGFWLAYGVSPCRESGHRLRTRAGHCVQCDPAKIAFIARHDKSAEIYVAHSARRHYTKVGSAEDAEVRVRSLNTHQYGRINDWKLVYRVACAQAGRIEFAVHSALEAHYLPRANAIGANSLQSQELFACDPSLAIEAVMKVVAK